MNNYRLQKISIKNFKLFDENPFTVNFNSNDLVVFDGPNGYGKTSIFDAIELALTGDIRRLLPIEKKQIPNDVVVAYKDSDDSEVQLTLSNVKDESTITVIRRLKKPLPLQSTKISNFDNLWDVFRLDNGREHLITQSELNDFIGVTHLVRDYTLFHYVEQADTAHFLKTNSEVERAKAISHLFGDTVDAQNRYKKFDAVDKILNKKIKSLTNRKQELEKQYEFSEDKGGARSKSLAEYMHLLSWRGTSFEWDLEQIDSFTSEKKDEFLKVLNCIKSIVQNKELFVSSRKYRLASSQDDVLESFLLNYDRLDKLESFKNTFYISEKILSSLKVISANKLSEIKNSVNLSELFKIVNYSSGNGFIGALTNVLELEVRNQKSNSLFNELIKYRNGLHNQFLNLTEHTDCPFCGSGFDSNNLLLKEIEERGGYFKSLLSDDDRKIIELKDSFIIDYLNPLKSALNLYLSNMNPPTKQLISSLEHANVLKSRLDKLVKWLSEENIDFSDLKFDDSRDLPPSHELEKRLKLLQTRISDKAPELSSSYLEDNSNYDFENAFNIYFDKNIPNLNKLSVADIDNKITFIINAYSNSLGSYYSEYKKLKITIDNLNLKSRKVNATKNKIKSAISTYQKKLIMDIEIPFYIYSGKILQTHQAGIGSGVFIKDKTGGQELKNIRLVSDWDSDHDVLNTMSTGQIAAIIISFYLALNKVYAQGLQTILIDDPVQTMDEINMISLVELLRNEFSDKQIILSTHEDHVSKYFLYKFIKYGCSASKIDLMEREEYQLSNTA